jgi:hypothetical protein
MIAPM